MTITPLETNAPVPAVADAAPPYDVGAIVHELLRPEAYPHPATNGTNLELHETHGAWVILAGPYAYKLKKPVNLGFFDFSTRERRDADADAEVRLNRRLAPQVYLGTVNVVERDGAIRVGGEGRVLERAVWMRRLPPDGMLSYLLDHDQATPTLVRRIARRMAAFHAGAATGLSVDEYGDPENIVANWQENLTQVRPFVGACIPAAHLAAIERYVTSFVTTQLFVV